MSPPYKQIFYFVVQGFNSNRKQKVLKDFRGEDKDCHVVPIPSRMLSGSGRDSSQWQKKNINLRD